MTEPADTRLPNAASLPPEERRARVHTALLAWYIADGRAHLPWRHTRDPYAVLVSEVMLQQTQVERVLPKYQAFLARFPTLAALAEAPISAVIQAWAPLGYNVRAVRLHAIARQAVEHYGGALPATLEGLLALKGIGRYTAGAVACFAFGLPVATVDTNIRRVLWRVFRGIEPARWPTGEIAARGALVLAEWALPPEAAYDWQQALMDLGATICGSRRPACERCPLVACCAAYAETARVTLFPSGEALTRLRDERAASMASMPQDATAGRVAARPAISAAEPRHTRQRAAQRPFTSTPRYFRGRIVDALRTLTPGASLPLAALGPRIKPDFTPEELPWLRGLARGLARDGLARLVEDAVEERISLP
ncbi:MAG: A/G-specific adenine glycosylase [Ktedonobacterales bacterium]|nr:A/G-specific adenine glycosylase [Ktedonobacterales bacterium]